MNQNAARMKLVALALTVLCFTAGTYAGERVLELEATINAPIAAVWKAWVDEAQVQQWMVAKAKIDLRVGGSFTTSYNQQSTLDDEHTIVNEILSFEPQRMLSIRNVRAPEHTDFPKVEFQQTWSVIYFDALSPATTKLRLVGMGFGEGAKWDQVYSFFEQGNAWVLAELKKFLESNHPETDPAQTLKELGRLVGGEWIHEGTPPNAPEGSIFRVRNVIELAGDGRSLVSKGWLGTGDGMFLHGNSQIWIEPATNQVLFQNINEQGHLARGEITLKDSWLVWEWNAYDADDGSATRYEVRMNFETDDRHRFVLSHRDGETLQQLVNITFDRMDRAPAHFFAAGDAGSHTTATKH